MRIIMPSDVFPPDGKGGAAWSSHALALGLLQRGHTVTAIVPRRGGRGVATEDALGVPALRVGYRAPNLPIIQNYFRHEHFWPQLARVIVDTAQRGPRPAIIHAQHVQTAPAAVLAGRALGVPVVVTVRDHWPWDYFATGLHGDQIPLPRQGWAELLTDLPARLGPVRGSLVALASPYLLAHRRRRAALLAQADAVIACSHYIAARLRVIMPAARVHVLPNLVDLATNQARAAVRPQTRWNGALLLFAGKLEPNKGAGLLPAIFRELRALAPTDLPTFTLVVAGDGTLRDPLAAELAELGIPTTFLAWADHDETLRLMAHCDLLLFPSAWGEPLSRVLLEAAALGAPILAMPTGGTSDIISDGRNGALAATPRTFAQRLLSLLQDPGARQQLGQRAQADAQARFDQRVMLPRYEALYASLQRKHKFH
ncbi:MAG: glycosyltransferase family 4 protein [Oscillochloridaceae bacterium umkhey_bin13]